MFKRWSNQKIQFYTLLVILGGILITLTVTTLESSLRCIDEQGCLIYSCVMHRFTEEYQTLIDLSINNNPKCCWKRYSTTNQCIGGYDNEAYYDNNSCQSDVNLFVIERRAVEAQTAQIDLQTIVTNALTQLQASDPQNAIFNPGEATDAQIKEQVEWVKKVDFTSFDNSFAPSEEVTSTSPIVQGLDCQSDDTVIKA